jgi:hypothetical protein
VCVLTQAPSILIAVACYDEVGRDIKLVRGLKTSQLLLCTIRNTSLWGFGVQHYYSTSVACSACANYGSKEVLL